VVKEKSSQFYPAAHLVARAFCHSRAPRTQYLEAGKFRYKVSPTPHLVFFSVTFDMVSMLGLMHAPSPLLPRLIFQKANWRCASSSMLQFNRRTHLYLSTRSEADLWIIEFDFTDNYPLYRVCQTRTRTPKTHSRYLNLSLSEHSTLCRV
jgi:hypothetical protein